MTLLKTKQIIFILGHLSVCLQFVCSQDKQNMKSGCLCPSVTYKIITLQTFLTITKQTIFLLGNRTTL